MIIFLWGVPGFAQFAESSNTSLIPDSIPFAPAVNYQVGHSPRSVFCTDLDGDGDLDLAVTNLGNNNVSILKNNGDATFQSAMDYQTGGVPRSVFCVDLDQDGDLDLVVANSGSNNVSILKNNGDGTFQAKVDYDAGSKPISVFCADLDGDYDLDLAVANYSGDNVSILKNNGDGTFQARVDYATGRKPVCVFCADLDRDEDLDLAVVNYFDGDVSILKNNGDGTFQPKVDYTAGEYPIFVFCTDLDGDSDWDLAISNTAGNNPLLLENNLEVADSSVADGSHSCGNVSILKNNGDGTFQNAVNYGTGIDPRSVFCADLDGDSDFDLATANYFSNNVSILKNNGDGTFQTKVYYGVGSKPISVFSADLDGDGDFDLAAANHQSNNVSILKNLTQIPANQLPSEFALIYPCGDEEGQDTTFQAVDFDWQTAYDPNFGDQIRYDLYVSTTPSFDESSTTVYSNLLISQHHVTLGMGACFWKVKATDNWGAFRWSDQTCEFYNRIYLTDTLTCVAFSPVDLILTDPKGDSIGLGFNTIPGANYDTSQDYNQDGDKDDIITLPDRFFGLYMIRVFPEPLEKGTYSLGIRIDGGAMNMLGKGYHFPVPEGVDTFYYYAPWYLAGDANSDWMWDLEDVVYLINYLFKNGPVPDPIGRGDANCDGILMLDDVVYLISYLYKGGPPPSC